MYIVTLFADRLGAEESDFKARLVDGGYFGIRHFRENDVVEARDRNITGDGISQFFCCVDGGKSKNVCHGKDGIQ